MISLASQLSALRRLNGIDGELRVLEKRLSTGAKVTDAKDSTSAVLAARASGSRSVSLASVQSSLDFGIASISAASSAVAQAAGALGNIRGLLTAAKDGNADLASIQNQLNEQRSHLRSAVFDATFKGVNLLANSTTLSGYLAAPRDAAGLSYSISVDPNRTRLFDTMGATGILQGTFSLTPVAPGIPVVPPSTLGLSGTATAIAGSAASTPGLGGLSGTASTISGLVADANAPATSGLSGTAGTVAGTDAATPATGGLAGTAATVEGTAAAQASVAKAVAGTYNSANNGNSAGDTVQLRVTLNGVTKTVEIYQRTISNRATLQSELQRAVDAQFSGLILANVATDNTITLSTRATGSGQSISVTNVSVVDGNDVTTSTLGLTPQSAYSDQTSTIGGQARVRDLLGTPDLAGIDRTDQLQLKIDGQFVNGNGDVTGSGSVTVKVGLGGVTDDASLASAINAAIQADPVGQDYFGAALVNGQIAVYHKSANARIRVSAITGLDGNGTTAGNLGFVAGGSGTGTSEVTAVAAKATTGTDFSAPTTLQSGAALRFDLTVNGVTKTVSITKGTVEAALGGQSGYATGSGTIGTIGQFASVVQRALADQGVSGIAVAASGNRLAFTKGGTPASGDSVSITNVQTVTATATNATLTTGSDFAGPRTIAANARLNFTLTVDNVATNLSITKADVDAVLNGRPGHATDSGTIANAGELALVLQSVMSRQGLAGIGVAADGNRLRFTKTTAGAGTIAISSVAGRSSATNASATAGSDFASPVTVASDAALAFDIAVDGNPARTIGIDKATVETALAGLAGRAADTGTIADIGQFVLVVRKALSDAGVSGIAVSASGNRLLLTRDAAGAGSIALGNAQSRASTAVAASLRTGSDFSGPVTIDAGASIGFDLAVDGGGATRVTIQRSTVEAALAGIAGRTAGTGMIGDASEFALVVRRAIAEAGVAGIVVAADGNRLTLSKTAAGSGAIAIGNVSAAAAVATTSSTTTIDSVNVGGTAFRSLGSAEQQVLLDDYVRNVEAIARRVDQARSYLDFVGGQLDTQSKHTSRLQGIEANRVSGLVDANLSADAARRSALEARLELARKSLEIINQSRRNILDLF